MFQETYKVIHDVAALKAYIEWLPELGPSEKYYGCLFARKKYCQSIPWPGSDKTQLKRFTATKENLLFKLRQLECPLGSFEIKGQAIPQDALALYLHVNPRDLWKATIKSIGQLAKVIECDGKTSNPHQEVLSEIQRSHGKKKYVVFDLDEKDQTKLRTIYETVDGHCEVMETRGGYHIFVPTAKARDITDKRWYNKVAELCDVTGDNMSPVPGCVQGGFVPKMLTAPCLNELALMDEVMTYGNR
jgi:hypothetical protein